MKYSIRIPEPCHENWGNMSPTEKGRFCTSCSKEVIDFSKMSAREVSNFLKGKKNVCGKVRQDQLNHAIYSQERSWQVNWALAIGIGSLLFVSIPLYAQSHIPQVNIVEQDTIVNTEILEGIDSQDNLSITGTILDEMEDPLPFTNVILQEFLSSKWVNLRGTTTDLDGYFKLEIPKEFMKRKLRLEFSYIGYETQRIPIDTEINNLEIFLKVDLHLFTTGMIIIDRSEKNVSDGTKGSTYEREGNDFVKKVR